MAFGKEILRLQTKAKWTASKLAKAMGVNDAKLRKWQERDSTPKEEDIKIIERSFGLSLDEIMKLKELPENFGGTIIEDPMGKIINQLIAVEAKLNILFSSEAERLSQLTNKKATDILREMNAAARLEADNLRAGVSQKS